MLPSCCQRADLQCGNSMSRLRRRTAVGVYISASREAFRIVPSQFVQRIAGGEEVPSLNKIPDSADQASNHRFRTADSSATRVALEISMPHDWLEPSSRIAAVLVTKNWFTILRRELSA